MVLKAENKEIFRILIVDYQLINKLSLMLCENQITTIFSTVDEFIIEFEAHLSVRQLGNKPKRKPRMNTSEVMTIMILFQLSGVRCFKWFYLNYVQKHLQSDFPQTVSYNRFVELQKGVVLPMAIFAKTCCLGQCTGISFIDSTPLRVCNKKRIFNHKVFKGIASRGKSTMGWFFGFKLHLIVNELGEIIDFQITQANVDDRQPLKQGNLLRKIWGKLYGDKGYVSKKLADVLFCDGIHFITGIRKNMKSQLMSLYDKIMLRKRSIIETINDQLKNICMIEHSRHRSFHNFINNILTGIIAYSFLPKKPKVKFYQYQPNKFNQLALF